MAILVALCALNLALLLAVLAVVWRLRQRIIRIREAERAEWPRSLWPQFESLTRLYRLLDGKADLPNLRHWAVSPDFLLHVVRHIQGHAPKTILECGSGSSTIAMAQALRAFGIAGHIYSIENYEPSVEAVRSQLQRHDLERFVTLVFVPLVQKQYDGTVGEFHWYDLQPGMIPDNIDLLLVDGPVAVEDPDARYPAGPELLPRLAHGAHIFIDDASRPGETDMVVRWRSLYPNLGLRKLPAEKGCVELFFLDEKRSAA
ncbi:MAG TPA: class I SAM-dependent methyltransferase [Dongiaceae bacterium]|jgi:predicted O-methyltransferase YrrM|nr:class I SAM-dependent methyltransferase [Dongiaceae bacterium]